MLQILNHQVCFTERFINALPHFEPLHFGFYLLKGDKRPSCLCPCARGLTHWRTSFNIDMEKKECLNFIYFSQVAFSNIVHLRVIPITTVLCIILKKWISNQVKLRFDKSTSDGNEKEDVVPGIMDEYERSIYGFVIGRHGSYGCVDGESRYLMFHC